MFVFIIIFYFLDTFLSFTNWFPAAEMWLVALFTSSNVADGQFIGIHTHFPSKQGLSGCLPL